MPSNYDKSLARELLAVHRTLGWMDLVIGNITDAVYVTDKEENLVFVNQIFSDLLEVPRVFLLGKKLSKVFKIQLKEELSQDLLPKNKKPVGTEDSVTNIYTWSVQGKELIYKVSSRYIETIRQTVYIATDITNEYEVSVMKSNFINIASHQLRTPMTAIMLYANMLKDGYGGSIDTVQRGLVDTIVHSSERMISLINDILLISRIQNGEENLTLKDSTLGESINSVTSEIDPGVKDKEQHLIIDVPKNIIDISCNDFIIHEILINLLSNAIQYTPKKGTITLKLYLHDGFVKMEVSDTGIGIPEDYIPQMYQQFSRAQNAFSVFNEGTGLGLYVVKMFVEQLQGSILCDSKIGYGTTFTVSFPV